MESFGVPVLILLMNLEEFTFRSILTPSASLLRKELFHGFLSVLQCDSGRKNLPKVSSMSTSFHIRF